MYSRTTKITDDGMEYYETIDDYLIEQASFITQTAISIVKWVCVFLLLVWFQASALTSQKVHNALCNDKYEQR